MKRTRPYISVMLLMGVLVGWLSCQRNVIRDVIVDPFTPELVRATVQGRVLNENKEPVGSALVKVNGNITTTTDINGFFRFNNVLLPKNAGFVQVEKSAYFMGSRTIVVNKDTVNYLQIELIPKVISGTFNAATGGSVTATSGGSIDFLANSIITSTTNSSYTGPVSVAAYLINPVAGNFAAIMPGDLRGVTINNEERGLQSFGMMAIELSGSLGEKLQLAAGKTAVINFPIPVSLQSLAPAVIPLWYFNDSTGIWKEQGSATKQGTKYSGTVSHFSFWNCDAIFPVIDFQATLVDQNGNAVSLSKVVIQKPKTNISSYGYTDAAGRVSGKIPSNELLTITVYDKCGNILLTQNIGPFTAKADLGTIILTLPTSNTLTISGSVNNCSGQPVTNGYVNILLDSQYYRSPVNNGQFSIFIQRCTNSVSSAGVYAVDVTTLQQSTTINLPINSIVHSTGQLSACGISSAQFINYRIDTMQYAMFGPPDSLMAMTFQGSSINIRGYTKLGSPYQNVSFSFNTATQLPGPYPVSALNISVGPTLYVKSGTINVNITQYGAVGQLISGSLSGNVTDSSNFSIIRPVSLNFSVLRRN